MNQPVTEPRATIGATVPKILNIGSGKDFRDDCLNIDVLDRVNPDIVVDLSRGIPDREFDTRFGPVNLRHHQFERAVAYDVLEHVPDLVPFMESVRDLLVIGGVFDVLVPYDLGYGAWQDPTHVRAFNEKSWLYYTEWAWYLGWNEYKFHIPQIIYHPSEIGQKRLDHGVQLVDLLLMPRCIDSMKVEMVKVEVTSN